jgi:glycerophosphoryl diester phosphodiesterase
MKIISHRGFWEVEKEKNSMDAFEKSFRMGLGVETDVRDYCGNLVISHDVANGDNILFEDFLSAYNKYDSKEMTLAINIKADGLQSKLMEQLANHNISNYFLFDMSIPEMVVYSRTTLNFFTHQSEYGPSPILYEKAMGVWLDSFEDIWYSNSCIKEHLDNGKYVCIVSAELHKRDNTKQWGQIKMLLKEVNGDKLILCTDYPTKAKEYFYD